MIDEYYNAVRNLPDLKHQLPALHIHHGQFGLLRPEHGPGSSGDPQGKDARNRCKQTLQRVFLLVLL